MLYCTAHAHEYHCVMIYAAEAMEYANTLTHAAERELAARAHELSAAEQHMYEDAT